MKKFDEILRDQRIARARRFIRPSDIIIDIGCSDGALFEQLKGLYRYGYGVEPTLEEMVKQEHYALYPGEFPSALPDGIQSDVVTMLAVMEHLRPEEQRAVADACYATLNPGGRVIITVPSPRVDDILHIGKKLHLVDATSIHEHYGFEPKNTLTVFAAPRFKLLNREKFQLGLNNLFVFEKA